MSGHFARTPDGKRVLWYARPAEHLLPYLTAYDGYDIRFFPGETGDDLLPPGWGAIRFTLDRGQWTTTIGRQVYQMPGSAVFGPTSHAGFTHFTTGHVVCVGLTPLGWARFMRVDASRYANRVTPLHEVPVGWGADLRIALEQSDDHAAVFDGWFTALLEDTPPAPAGVAELLPLLLDPTVATIGDIAERLGMTTHEVGRISTRHFGFKPKLLLRRARFMRALVQIFRTDRGGWASIVRAAGYHDQSHFVRDCHLFLDSSPTRFMKRPKPLFETSLRLRAAVMGTPVQALHPQAPVRE